MEYQEPQIASFYGIKRKKEEKDSPISCAIEWIDFQKKKEESKDVWEDSVFNDITKLESNIWRFGSLFVILYKYT